MAARDGHIRVLPLHVANKIAAGEVVERPASVVKEFVENAIDAGAANIRINTVQGGRKLVSVADDGCGMTRDDALLSLERQATSKILDVDDIERIDTLGFRGEAIPSIASVSRFTMLTRRKDSDEGTAVEVNAGTIAGVRPAGCPPGTIVEARDLFCNVPARRKFLRSYQTEESHIRRVFTVHALAHPSIGFSLESDGREICRLSPSGGLDERITELFGAEFFECLLPVDATLSGIRVWGYIEKPNRAFPSRREQYVFVNSRPATAPVISCSIRDAYPRESGDARPATILFISLPPGEVDVNVHPTKREVRFRNSAAVRSAISLALDKALHGNTNPDPAPAGRMPDAGKTETRAATSAPASNPIPPFAQFQTSGAFQSTGAFQAPADPPAFPKLEPVQVEFAAESAVPSSKPWKWFRFLATTSSGFVLLETDAGLATLDPKAARERIAYEKLLSAKKDRSAKHSQALLMPEMVTLPPLDAMRTKESIPELESFGFSIEDFGSGTFKIDAVPAILRGMPLPDILRAISRDAAENGRRRAGDGFREETVAKSIAKSCAGASPSLDAKTATALVEELTCCRMPYVTPKGRPVMIFTSTRELERKFQRL